MSNFVGVKPQDLSLPAPAGGLNHCAAILELRLKDGSDAFPQLKNTNRVERWVLENYGILPYCWTHWTEFFPSLSRLDREYKGRLQGLTMKYGVKVEDMQLERRRVEMWEMLLKESSRGTRTISPETLPETKTVEVVEIIESILENRNEVYVVNIPNNGAIDNLPNEAIVEVSCVVGRYGIRPIHVATLPGPIAGLLSNYVRVQELTVQAALSGDWNTAYQAYLHDPQTSSRLTPEETEQLLNELLTAHAQYLPRFKSNQRQAG